jgi:heterodisulfide reductase subunit A-like polyferredoxin
MAPSVVFKTALDSTVPTSYPPASDLPDELGFDPSGLKAKYAAEREKRLHQDGNDQYRSIDGALSNDMRHNRGLNFSRDPVELDPDVVIIGGGYGGQLVAVRLIEQGINNFCVIEKGGDFGGTWCVLEMVLCCIQLTRAS